MVEADRKLIKARKREVAPRERRPISVIRTSLFGGWLPMNSVAGMALVGDSMDMHRMERISLADRYLEDWRSEKCQCTSSMPTSLGFESLDHLFEFKK